MDKKRKPDNATDLRSQMESEVSARHTPWHLQAAGYLLMTMVVLGGLTGIFGNGPLSEALVQDPRGQLMVQYPRMARRSSEMELTVRVQTEPGDGWLRLSVPADYIGRANLQRVLPHPERSELGNEWVTFWFQRPPSESRVTVIIQMKPARAGSLSGAAALDRGTVVRFSQFIYP